MAQSSERETNGQLADLTDPQWEFATDTEHRYLAFVSGVGAGKTFAGIARTFANLERWNAGYMGAIIAPARRMIVDVIIPQMRDLGFFDPPFKWEYNSAHSSQPGIHTPDGSRALVLSANNERTIQRLRGLNLSWGWIDEESIVDPRARDILNQRLRVGDYRNLYATTTPKGKNHTWEFFAENIPEREGWNGPGVIYENEDTMTIAGVSTGQNPELPEDYQDAMQKDMPDDIRAQEVEGRFVEIGSGVLQKDMLHYVKPEEIPDRQLSYYVGVDIGVQADASTARSQDSDYWAAAVLGVDPLKNNGYLLDLHRERGMTLREGVEWLRGIKDQAGNPEFIIESNQSQRFLTQEAENAGLRVSKIYNTDNKEDRLIQLSIPFSNSTIQLVDWGDNRWESFVQEWIGFPESSHDDTLDAVEIAVSQASLGGGYSMFEGEAYDRD